MDFDLSDDQRALKDGIAALLDGVLPLEATRSAEHHADVVDPTAWAALAEAGVFSLLVPEPEGGVGFGLAEGTVVFEELGRVLAPGPLIATTALAPVLPAAAEGIAHAVIDAPGRSAAPPLLEHPATCEAVVVLPRIEQVAEEAALVPVGDLAATPVERSLDPLTPLASLATPLPVGTPLEGVDTVEQQVSIALQKAGISPDQGFDVRRFRVTRYREGDPAAELGAGPAGPVCD